MKAFLTLLVFSWLATLFMPWWGIVIPGLIVGAWLLTKGGQAFLIGFLAAGLAWFLQALYTDIANESILSTRIAEVMGVQSSVVILLLTFLVGAVLGGLSTLVGTRFKVAFKPQAKVEKSKTV